MRAGEAFSTGQLPGMRDGRTRRVHGGVGKYDPGVDVLLRAENLTKQYGSVTALDHVTFEIGATVTGLLGANGAGKSTAIKLFLGLTGPEEMLALIRKTHREFGISLVMSSHLMGDIERTCERILVLENGRVVEEGETSTFTEASETLYIEVTARRSELIAALAERDVTATEEGSSLVVDGVSGEDYDRIRDALGAGGWSRRGGGGGGAAAGASQPPARFSISVSAATRGNGRADAAPCSPS